MREFKECQVNAVKAIAGHNLNIRYVVIVYTTVHIVRKA